MGKCVCGVGRGVERVLGWGHRILGLGWEREGGGGGKCGEKCGTIQGAGKFGEKGGVTIWDPNSPDPYPPTSRLQLPQLPTHPVPPTPTPPSLRFLAATRIFPFFKLGVECTLCGISGKK